MLNDVKQFVRKYGLGNNPVPSIHNDMAIRINHIEEELCELKVAVDYQNKPEVIDALLDIVYIALGTAEMCGFDTQAHWDEIQRANMSKVKGVTKRGHSNDVSKPEGWVGPDHESIIKKTMRDSRKAFKDECDSKLTPRQAASAMHTYDADVRNIINHTPKFVTEK